MHLITIYRQFLHGFVALYFTKGSLIYPSLEEILIISERLSLMANLSQKDIYDAFWSLHGIGLALKCLYKMFTTTGRKSL